MAKLKHIVRQLSQNDYLAIYDSLIESNAEKSAYLLQALREKSLSDTKVMQELEVNTNAYYTLRSRLNQKIEEYLLEQMESPRTDLLKKVANINEITFTKKRAIVVATLRKLEKELLDYDLSNELTVVYKALKKLHIHSSEYFNYSKLYNQHVAYMLSIDKAEDLLTEYFKKFSSFALSGDETDRLGLEFLYKEMESVGSLYQSHRLFVYQSCLSIFHRLFIEEGEVHDNHAEPIEDVLKRVEDIFQEYSLDSTYFHLKLVFQFLRLEYYNYYKVYRKAESYFEEVNEGASSLLSNYNLYTYPSRFLQTKINRHIRLKSEHELYEEDQSLFVDFEPDPDNIPQYVNYMTYRGISSYYAGKYEEAAKWLNTLLNEVSLKKFPHAMLEVKCILALQYCCLRDFDLFNQLVNSIQRQIRILGKESCEFVVIFVKIMKIALSEAKREKEIKIKALIEKANFVKTARIFEPTRYIELDERFISELIGI